MKQKSSSPPALAPLLGKITSLWPALKGSLALVRKPCIRPACPACASGQKHPAYLLSFTHKGRRKCMYVPVKLVGLLRRSLNNGRRIEELLSQAGPALIREHRQNRARITPPQKRASQTKSGISKRSTKSKS